MDAFNIALVAPVTVSAEKGVYKGMPVEAWEPVTAQRMARRASLTLSRSGINPLGRGRSLQVNVAPAVVSSPLGSSPARAVTFPRDDDSSRTRRRRRRYSEHPHSHRRDDSENRPATARAPAAPLAPPPRRPERHPTLNLHDVEDAFSPPVEPHHPRRWADTPGASSVAAWVREQQVQSQYQFAPLSPPPSAKTQKGFLGKVKKLMGGRKGGE